MLRACCAQGVGKYRILGTTVDDSVGECFDKTARLMGFTPIPGGPLLERLARLGDAAACKARLTMPMQNGQHKVSGAARGRVRGVGGLLLSPPGVP